MIQWTEFYLKFLSFPIFLTRLAQQLSALWMEGLIGVLIDWFSFSRGNKTWVICAKVDMIMHYSGAEKFVLGYFGLPSMSITSPTKSITSPITLTWLIPTYLRQHSHQLRPLKNYDHNFKQSVKLSRGRKLIWLTRRSTLLQDMGEESKRKNNGHL